jgi:hypothetical protein
MTVKFSTAEAAEHAEKKTVFISAVSVLSAVNSKTPTLSEYKNESNC